MSDLFTVKSRLGATTPCIEYADKGTGRTVDFIDALGAAQSGKHLVFTATLAQINAGYIFLPADPARNIIPIGFRLVVTGNFATLTDVRLSDTNGTPVDIVTIVQAQLTTGSIFGTGSATGVTFGAGFQAALTAGAGVQIRSTGTAGTGGTSISGLFSYILG
jgi:hypothetical protein